MLLIPLPKDTAGCPFLISCGRCSPWQADKDSPGGKRDKGLIRRHDTYSPKSWAGAKQVDRICCNRCAVTGLTAKQLLGRMKDFLSPLRFGTLALKSDLCFSTLVRERRQSVRM
jgi:hypothetical protein